MSEEDAAVSALDATASVDSVAEDEVKVDSVDADNEPENCNIVVMAQSDKNEDGTLGLCIQISFCMLYHANLIIFFV
jgi:hypothetical protein